MNKNQKIILIGAIVVFLGLSALIIVLIVKNAEQTRRANEMVEQNEAMLEQAAEMQERNDSLRSITEQMELDGLTAEFDRLNAEFSQYNDQQLNIKNDTLKRQYNEAKARVDALIKELAQEKKSSAANAAASKEKIKQLEAELTTLKGIAKHYLEEIRRLNEENQGLRQELSTERGRNETLAQENASVSRSNAQLAQTVQLAKKLNITGLSLSAYNKNSKTEKNITKAAKLGVSFTVTPNNTAAPGMKTFNIRILSPEGNVLGGGTPISYDGASIAGTAARQLEYDNQELPVTIYWGVNTTLTPGDYTVEVFCDGYRLGSGRFYKSK